MLKIMKKKMLQFINLNQTTPVKRDKKVRKKISMKSIKITLVRKLKNNQVGVRSVGFPFVKCTVHFITIFLIG